MNINNFSARLRIHAAVLSILHFAQIGRISFFTQMSNARTVNATWSKDDLDLLFTFDDGNPETDYFYHVSKAQLIGTAPDHINWMRQLSGKSWFSQVRQQVERMIEEAKKCE